MRTLWGQNTQRIELPSCKSWKLNWHVSNSLSFYSRYDCGFHHLVLGPFPRSGGTPAEWDNCLKTHPCPWNTRPLDNLKHLLVERKKRIGSEGNSCCFTHDWLDGGVSVLEAYKLCKSAHFKQIVQICAEFHSIAQAVDRKSDLDGIFSSTRNLLHNIQLVSVLLQGKPSPPAATICQN